MSPTTRSGAIALGAVGGVLSGALLGAVVGNLVVRERWEPAELPGTVIPRLVQADAPDELPERRTTVSVLDRRGWSIDMGFGKPADISSQMRQALIENGFGDSVECWLFCSGSIDYPVSTTSEPGFQVAVHRTIGSNFDAGVRYSRARLDKTTGFDARSNTRVSMTPEVRIAEALARLKGSSRLYLAAGAGVYDLSIHDESDRSPGVFVEGGAELIRWGRASIFIEARYRKVGSLSFELVGEHGYFSDTGQTVLGKSAIDLSSFSGATGISLFF
jgi:hypothetical protein